jgi:hypothetical protein
MNDMYKKILSACIALLVTTAIYTIFLYKTEKIDRTLIFERIMTAYDNGDLLANPFPPSGGLASSDNLSGIDQMVESHYALMVMYKDKEHRMMNSLNPGFYKKVENNLPTSVQAKICAFASKETLDDPKVRGVDHKPRFWHGVKALLLCGLQYLQLSQMHWMIEISTFFAFSLIASQIMFLDRKVGLANTAFTLSAFYCSSILFFGGVAYSVPHLGVALWGVVWLSFRMLPCRHNKTIEIFILTLGGTFFSFFYQLGGCEIYAMSFIIFVEIFLPTEEVSTRNLIKVFESCAYYLIGFFGSIVLKHLLIVYLAGSFDVLVEFINKIIYRTSNTNDYGTKIGFINIVGAQFHWYGIAAYGIEAIFQFVNASKYLSFILIGITSSWLAVLKFFGQKTEFEDLFVAFCGFIFMLGTVVFRYMLLRNHSDIHVFFVDRYLFVFAGTVYFFLLWLIISSRRFLPKRQGNRQT